MITQAVSDGFWLLRIEINSMTIFDKWLSLPEPTKIDLIDKQWARPIVKEPLN